MLQEIKYCLAFTILVFATGLNAKPRSVYLDKELKEAQLIEYVEIVNYKDTTIVFKTLESKKVLSAKTTHLVVPGFDSVDFKTGYWPLIGDKVLIVIGSDGFVSLFAEKEASNYRFWSPSFTFSKAIFFFKKPARRLPYRDGLMYYLGDYETCWDGCLLPIDKLKRYGRE